MNEVKIEETITGFYHTYIWRNQWVTISKHRYKSDAEIIGSQLVSNSVKEVKEYLLTQMDSRVNTIIAPYYIN